MDFSVIQKLNSVLHNEIPITKSLGIRVNSYENGVMTLVAPLSNNINHKCTAFGGSLYSICVLTGWSLIYAKLNEQNSSPHIVIQKSNIDYRLPVAEEDILATCRFESNKQVDKFLTVYQRKRVSRIKLTVEIRQSGALAVVFSGQYVIHSD